MNGLNQIRHSKKCKSCHICIFSPFDLSIILWHFLLLYRNFLPRAPYQYLQGIGQMLRVISLVIGLSFFGTLSVSSSPALAWGDTLIKCKIKGVGVRNFKLEDGIWSDKVWERKNNTDWKEWCPETDKQNMKIGGDELICMVAGKKHRDMLIWGRTIINFEKPSWEMRYRFAKPGQAYVDSAPGGRETATCKIWAD